MNSIQLIKLTQADLEALQQLSRSTFIDTYEWYNTAADMESYINDHFSEANLLKELGNDHSAFWFAKKDADNIGYIKINMGNAQTDLKDKNTLEVERIYVLKAYHGQQVGKLMIQQAVEYAKEKKADFIWLGVWEKNEKAIRFYEKNGFIRYSTHKFILGDDIQNDFIMKLDINN